MSMHRKGQWLSIMRDHHFTVFKFRTPFPLMDRCMLDFDLEFYIMRKNFLHSRANNHHTALKQISNCTQCVDLHTSIVAFFLFSPLKCRVVQLCLILHVFVRSCLCCCPSSFDNVLRDLHDNKNDIMRKRCETMSHGMWNGSFNSKTHTRWNWRPDSSQHQLISNSYDLSFASSWTPTMLHEQRHMTSSHTLLHRGRELGREPKSAQLKEGRHGMSECSGHLHLCNGFNPF